MDYSQKIQNIFLPQDKKVLHKDKLCNKTMVANLCCLQTQHVCCDLSKLIFQFTD